MTPEDKQHFEDIIVKAVQSGKKETSDLADHIIHKIEPAVEASISKYVNGKINTLTQKLDDYIAEDLKWKAEYEPYLKGMASINLGGRIIIKAIITVGTIIGAWAVIKQFFHGN